MIVNAAHARQMSVIVAAVPVPEHTAEVIAAFRGGDRRGT
jgi:hypothetical protein